MNQQEAMPPKYLNGENETIPFEGKKVTIESAAHEMVKDPMTEKETQKFVVRFEDIDSGLILNKTNAEVLFKGLAKNTDEWEGKEVIVYRTHGEAFGKPKDMVRLRLVETPTQARLPTA